MAYKPDLVAQRLVEKFGFKLAHNRSPSHKYYVLQISDDLPLIETHFSHDGKEIRDTLEGEIRKQLKVRKEFFYGMMDCPKSREDYYSQVKQDPYPPFPDYVMKRISKRDKK